MRQDIRNHSDEELSLLVFNNEFLYKQRHRHGFFQLIDELFIFTDDQLLILNEDLELDLQELES